MTTSNHHDEPTHALISGEQINHAARIASIARDRRNAEPDNHEGHRRITAARLAAAGRQLST